MPIPANLTNCSLSDAENMLANGRCSEADFVAFFSEWCKGKMSYRVHDGKMQVSLCDDRKGEPIWTSLKVRAPSVPGTCYREFPAAIA